MLKHIIVGTAGHIDHGKTTLIKALTGRDTDTLKEEKDRGISINLGFTFFDLPSGRRAGIIDVPGHEKFIKNMLAGVSGIDVVLLVIAADEGIMPQTKEHFEILQLLNVKKGIIVLTKADLVDDDWISMVKEDIFNEFRGTFLENAPVCTVSSKTRQGLKELTEEIDKITEETEPKDTEGHFRLPVDRVFSITGFGTVVTGTMIGGQIAEGQTVKIYPSGIMTKVRSIQVHDVPVKSAEAGQRCAINLANIKLDEIQRGDVVSIDKIMEPSIIVDGSFYYLKSAGKPLVNNHRIRFYHGTSEIIGRVLLLDRDELKPGEHAYVQIRLEKPVTAQRNDRYVIRSYSPMHTIGGGSIINPAAKKAKRFDEKYIEELKLKESDKAESILEAVVEKMSKDFPDSIAILKAIGKNEENFNDKLEELVNDKKIVKLNSLEKPIFIHAKFLKYISGKIIDILTEYHRSNPLKMGLSKEEIKNRIFGKNIKQKIYDEIISVLESRNSISIHGSFVSLYGFEIKYDKAQQDIKNRIMTKYKEARFMPPKYDELIANEKDRKSFKMVYDSLLDSGVLFKISEDCIIYKDCFDEARNLIVKQIRENGKISAAEARDVLNTSRKYAVAVLEYFDSIKLTKRVEDYRTLY